MKNDDLTKLARWVVPGWTAITAFLLFVFCDVAFSPPNSPFHLFNDLSELIKSITGVDAILVTLLIAGSGIPIGFIIYQFYFFLRWNSPFSRDGLLALIPGRMKDLERTTFGLDKKLALNSNWRKQKISHPLFRIDHGFKWRYIEPLFLQACAELDSKYPNLSIYSRHRYLHEVVHTLGASIGAIYFGFAGYMALKVLKEGIPLTPYLLGIVVISGSFFWLLHYEDLERYNLFMQKIVLPFPTGIPTLQITVGKVGFSYPSSQLLITLGLVVFFAHPVLNPTPNEEDLIIKFIVSALFLATWGVSQNNLQRKYKWGNLIWAISSLLLAIFVRLNATLFIWIDWAFFVTFLLFLVLNLVLFLNRRNANEDMLALENYTLYRYLSKEKSFLPKE